MPDLAEGSMKALDVSGNPALFFNLEGNFTHTATYAPVWAVAGERRAAGAEIDVRGATANLIFAWPVVASRRRSSI
jgi:hypothetical protein